MTSTMSRSGSRKRAVESLSRNHVEAVREVLDANRGLSVRKLVPLVAARCGLERLNEHSLHVFVAVHQIPRVVSAGTFKRTQALIARGVVALSGPMVVQATEALPAPCAGGSDERPALSPASDPTGIWAARERGRARLGALREQAHLRATGWLQAPQVAAVAKLALEGALRHSRREPDPEEFDPEDPQAWFDPVVFAEDVADLFKLGVLELATQAGFEGAEHQRSQLSGLGGSEAVLRPLRPESERGLGQRPREHAAGGGDSEFDSSTATVADAVR